MFAFNIRGKPWKEISLSAILPLLLLPLSAYGRSALQDSTDLKIKNGSESAIGAENSIFIHPTNSRIILEAHIFSGGSTGWVSQDGGKTWSGENSAIGSSGGNGDPSAAILAAIGNDPARYLVQQLASPGDYVSIQRVDFKDSPTSLSWADSTIYNSEETDRGHLWANNDALSSYYGYLFSAWSTTAGRVRFARSPSASRGASWEEFDYIDQGTGSKEWGVNLKTGMSSGRRSHVYAVWGQDGSNPAGQITSIKFNKSINGGTDWGTPGSVASPIAGYSMTSGGLNSGPSMAVDGSGKIYVVWCEENRGSGSDAEVYISRSGNEGTSWLDPVAICQDTTGSNQWDPWVTWDDCTNTLAVAFLDGRLGSANTYVACSQDSGETWHEFKVSDTGRSATGGWAGDYIGIAARDGIAYPVWSDNRDSTNIFRPYVSPFYLWGVNQSSVSDSIVGLSADSIRVTASWSTTLAATGGDYITLYPPGGGTPLTSPSCTSCGDTSHAMSFTVLCQSGYWYYTVKSTRPGSPARGSNEKFLQKVSNCIE